LAQFTVYTNTNEATKGVYPYLLDIQNSLLDSLETRLVIPLIALSKYNKTPVNDIMPEITINKKKYIIMTPLIAGVHKNNLGQKVLETQNQRQSVISAIDFMITGF
jgi:toxin CcdB